MSATVYALTAEVREAALDVKAVQRRIGAAGPRALAPPAPSPAIERGPISDDESKR